MMAGRPGTADRRITFAFALSVVGAVGFGVVYIAGGNVHLEGVSLFVAFAGLAVGLGVWAQEQMPQGPYVEERERMRSSSEARAVLAAELDRDDEPLSTVNLPRRALGLAVAALAAVLVLPVRSLFRGPEPGPALASTPWHDGVVVVHRDGTPVRRADLDVGTMLTVYPEGHTEAGDVAVALIRAEPTDLTLGTDREGWTVDGIVAYSKICTHAGCPVGQYVPTTGRLMCPCHQSLFDAWGGAVPVAGPAARPLPQLPLDVDDEDVLIARGGFPDPIGPGYWRQM